MLRGFRSGAGQQRSSLEGRIIARCEVKTLLKLLTVLLQLLYEVIGLQGNQHD